MCKQRFALAAKLALKGKTLTTTAARKAEQLSKSGSKAVAAKSAINTVLASLEDSKAEDIVSIDIEGKSALADYMVVASGRSSRHVAAIAEQLMSAMKDHGYGNVRVEGLQAADWVLIDADDVIIHVFRPEVRTFYNLEKMWQTPDLDPTRH
ncbi:MAG: ribosome silencing factor [Rhizobiaceae bacterium]